MKSSRSCLVFLMVATGLAAAQPAATDAPGGGFRERITEAELLKLRGQPPVLTGSAPAETAAPAAPCDFADASTFISFNGLSTFVPKGAVLHVPERLRGCIVAGMEGEVVLWQDFLRRFPAMVETFEVTLQEAAGAKAIEPNRLAGVMRSERIVVGAIGGFPTSVSLPAH